MPRNTQRPIDYAKFDAMNLEELEEYLRADFQESEKESNIEELLYASQRLAGLKKSEAEWEQETQRAWADFNQYYRADESEASKTVAFGRRRVRGAVRAAAVAAVVAAFLFASTMIASAQGIDIWASLSNWTLETFGFSFYEQPHRDEVLDYHHVPEQLTELADCLEQYDVGNNVIPSYLPDDTQALETKLSVRDKYTKISCMLENDTDSIVIQYYVYSEPYQGVEYQKNDIQPERYEANGTTYYISLNVDVYQCVWTFENIECSITGVHSWDTLIQIINSIQGS